MRKILPLLLCCALLTGCTRDQADPPEDGVSRMPLQAILDQLLELSDLHLGALFSAGEPTRSEVAYAVGAEHFTLPYDEALLYGPAVGISAFELLLFRLAPGADAPAFAQALQQCAHCDHWAYLQADFADTAVNGQIVLFLMADDAICPDRTRAALQAAFAAVDPLAYDPEAYVSAAGPVVLVGEAAMSELLGEVAGDCEWLGQPPYAALAEAPALSALDTSVIADSAVWTGEAALCGLVRLRSDAALPGFAAEISVALAQPDRGRLTLIVYGSRLVGFCCAEAPEAFAATGSMIRRFGMTDYEKNFTKTS